jgi:hypothetical protein
MRMTWLPSLRTTVALSLLLVLLVAAAPADQVLIVGPKGKQTLSSADLASLPQTEVTISDHGKTAKFSGVELHVLLERVGMAAGEHLRGKEVARSVVIEASDGYRAVFSLAELSPEFTDRKVILASRRDGKTLSPEAGPFQIAVEGEKKMARCVRQVTVIRIDEAH